MKRPFLLSLAVLLAAAGWSVSVSVPAHGSSLSASSGTPPLYLGPLRVRPTHVRVGQVVTTVELAADGGGTQLLLTEQVAFLDGVDGSASRQRGWGGLLDRLGDALRTRPPTAQS